ncbi:hypothetical protein [Novisyntrophococcus fermenticellae]|uniref:hypothetical protein n=1 Tax=Novisyntrophococcus fermenticellae TaxID=2068655 RepID=UPI001E3EA399|nr:hypothetical protein [Novisyntrophococcus fermenticellae]
MAEVITQMKDTAYAEKTRFLGIIKEKDDQIERLTDKLRQSEQNIESIKCDIKEKYQPYIDNYDSIGRLVFDAQVRADGIIKDAEETSTRMIAQAQTAARECLESVQKEVDDRLSEGKKKYIAVQEELGATVELMNQVQRRFMEACKAVNNIVSSVPESMQELESEMEEDSYSEDQLFEEAAFLTADEADGGHDEDIDSNKSDEAENQE